MLTIIPAIDIIDGKCVRLAKGDYNQKKVYNENPLDVALQFEAHGLKRLHLVDLDGAKAKHVINWKVLEAISTKTSLEIDFGGGIKSEDDLKIIFECGASMATIGSVAVKEPELLFGWITKHGSEKIILGADVNERKIAVSGWLETTDTELIVFLEKHIKKGISKVLCTDISKDGMLEGTSHELYKEVMLKFPDLYLIASGGVTTIDELEKLTENKIPAAIIGKAIYEEKILLSDLEKMILTGNYC
ncbi:MAG: 1-(5-phosphoribosyl)-5-[(5-phosphoribosylamino)methylideneamino]imidazole-4-carboxamide isomerase [Bacteroidales bacterium]|nr:1-(5-phosphoribosyl)-5-[(5-phosphoribosylamino)methylideneamino]imidazole-4-carboxamide isomerase [Bacteroidales bacterium]MBN2821014.1 1-(5-phosphoribosyl)-5-[(5-phosphoribosylamino)methylideneamino]imidazole-4-carboxamide isomerase [Bacteroidales bacterium]